MSICVWLNFTFLVLSMIIFTALYSISLMPATRSKKRGERVWKESKIYRIIASIFEIIFTTCLIFWYWLPIPTVAWKIFVTRWWIGLIIFSVIFIPGLIIVLKGVKDAGSETLSPSEETKIYGGIYKKIRHPQTLGEMPMFVALAFALNSWFLVIFTSIFIILYTPLTLYLEEKDLVIRFGEDYCQYKKELGVLLPKLRKRKNDN